MMRAMNEREIGIGDEVEIEVETPRFGFVKRVASGEVDFVSPIPTLFNYGFVPGTRADDGDPLDVMLLGPRLRRGTRTRGMVQARVDFTDAGARDDKLVCKAEPLTAAERLAIALFFRLYARLKGGLNALRGRSGVTAFGGIDEGRACRPGKKRG